MRRTLHKRASIDLTHALRPSLVLPGDPSLSKDLGLFHVRSKTGHSGFLSSKALDRCTQNYIELPDWPQKNGEASALSAARRIYAQTWLQTFLFKRELHIQDISLLPIDASHRFYYRLRVQSQKHPKDCSSRTRSRSRKNHSVSSLLFMICPLFEKPLSFLYIARLLQTYQCKTPRIYAHHRGAHCHFFIIEDFGHTSFRRLLTPLHPKKSSLKTQPFEAQPCASYKAVYTLAVCTLLHIAHRMPKKPSMLRRHTTRHFLKDVMLFTQWYQCQDLLPHCNLDRQAVHQWRVLWQNLLKNVWPACVFMHKDFHGDNLFYVPPFQKDQEGHKISSVDVAPDVASYAQTSSPLHCGIIDFQDAAWGPPGYDIMSLMYDARIDIPESLRKDIVNQYVDAYINQRFPHIPQSHLALKTSLSQSMRILHMQRQFRILGVFSRLCYKDHKRHYIAYVPRIWGYVKECINDPIFSGLRAWLIHYDLLPHDIDQTPCISSANRQAHFKDMA